MRGRVHVCCKSLSALQELLGTPAVPAYDCWPEDGGGDDFCYVKATGPRLAFSTSAKTSASEERRGYRACVCVLSQWSRADGCMFSVFVSRSAGGPS